LIPWDISFSFKLFFFLLSSRPAGLNVMKERKINFKKENVFDVPRMYRRLRTF